MTTKRLFRAIDRAPSIKDDDVFVAPREMDAITTAAAADGAMSGGPIARGERKMLARHDLFVPVWSFEVERPREMSPIAPGVRIILTRSVVARSLTPYALRERILFRELATREPRRLAGARLGDAEMVDPDISRADAEDRAVEGIERGLLQPTSQVRYEAKRTRLTYAPITIALFECDGRTEDGIGPFYAVVSGMTGTVLGSHGPSIGRALAKGFRKILSFDF